MYSQSTNIAREYEIVITNHAKERAKERMSLKKDSVLRMAKKALSRGIKTADAQGDLSDFMMRRIANTEGNGDVRVYGEHVYIFRRDDKQRKYILVTLYRLPSQVQKQAAAKQRQRKDSIDMLFQSLLRTRPAVN